LYEIGTKMQTRKMRVRDGGWGDSVVLVVAGPRIWTFVALELDMLIMADNVFRSILVWSRSQNGKTASPNSVTAALNRALIRVTVAMKAFANGRFLKNT
jgi:hypothetical protein